MERIFDPFVTTREDGAGLGLAVTWRLIGDHGGALEVENGADGVAFQIWRPRGAPRAQGETESSGPTP